MIQYTLLLHVVHQPLELLYLFASHLHMAHHILLFAIRPIHSQLILRTNLIGKLRYRLIMLLEIFCNREAIIQLPTLYLGMDLCYTPQFQ